MPAACILAALDLMWMGLLSRLGDARVPIEAANAAFRAVPVAAGRHEVRFDYRPGSVRAGAIVSVIALAILAACLLIRRRRG